ncbi:hypothetical protein [Streptomyces sp. NPDC017993]|uniref:hypothetical protein n=1 Tax=Streptomyces sp. NPDC017993 TaxID=3365027 RepID=UPI0037B2C6FD
METANATAHRDTTGDPGTTPAGNGRGGGPLTLLTLGLLLERPMTVQELVDTARERAADSPVGARTPTEREFASATVELRHAALTSGHPTPGGDAHALTARGRADFAHRVRALLATADEPQPPFHTAVGYLGAMEREAAVAGLRARVVALRERAARIDATLAGGSGIPRLFLIENEYARHMCGAELNWVDGILEEIGSGALTWPAVEITEDGWRWDEGAAPVPAP